MPPFAGLVECEAVGPMPENTTKPQLHVYDRCIQRHRWALMHLVISKLSRCLLAMVHRDYLQPSRCFGSLMGMQGTPHMR